MLSNGSDRELCESAIYQRTYTRQRHESRRLRSLISDVLYLDEVKAALAGCSPDSSVFYGEHGGRERDCRLWFSSSVRLCLGSRWKKKRHPAARGPPNPSPHRPDQSRGAPSRPLPGLPQQAPESLLGAGSVLSCVPWGHLPLMPPW